MTTVRVDNISNPIPGGQYSAVGVGIAIGNGIGLTAGHVANYEVITGGDGRTGHLIPPGNVKIVFDKSELSYSSGQTYYNEVLRSANEAVRYYNAWWSAYSEWKTAFVTWQGEGGDSSPPELTSYLAHRNIGSSPYPAYSLCGPVGTKSPNFSPENVRSTDPDAIYNLLPQPTTKSILGEMSLKSRDSVLYKSNGYYSSDSPGLALFYNKSDLQALQSALGSSAQISFNDGVSVKGSITSTSVGGDITGRLFTFRADGSGNNAVNGNSGSPFLIAFGGSDYVFGTVSASSVLRSSLQNVCAAGENSNYEVRADPRGSTTGVYIDKSSFDEFNEAINAKSSPSIKGPANLIVGVNRTSAGTAVGDFGVADGTLRRDLFIGTYGKELFKASGGDTVRVGSGDNIVDFDPSRSPDLHGAMTVEFGKTATGVASGNTVVEVDIGADNDYVLDLSSDAGITPDNIDIIAGGQSLYWYPGAPDIAQPGPSDGGFMEAANQRWLDNSHVEFLSVRLSDANGGSTITFVDKNTKVGIATTAHDGIMGAVNRSPITKIKFANGTWDAQQIFDHIVQKEKSTGGQGVEFPGAYDTSAGVRLSTFDEFFGPDPLNASGQSSISLTQPTQSLVSRPVVTAFADAESDIIVTGQSGGAGGSSGQAATTGNPYALYGTAHGQTLDAGGTYSAVYGEGGGDTFIFNQGYGQVLIEEADTAATPSNVLLLGSGISASTTVVSANDSGDVILDFGNGDSVVLAGELLSANGTTYGVHQVQFADGTMWTYADLQAGLQTASANSPVLYGTAGADVMDGNGLSQTLEGFGGGDAFVFKKGYGALAIEEKDAASIPGNILKLGVGLTAANVTVTADSSGMITIDFGGGDQVWLVGQLNSGGGIAYGVQQIQFADGTIWTQADLVSRLDVVNPNSTTLYGDNTGHTFDTQGIDDAIVSHGGGDTIVYKQGYGALTLSVTDLGANPNNVLQLGAGITTAGTAVTADANGDLILDFGNGDSVTLTGALNSSGGTIYGVQAIDFTDGTVWHYADLLSAAEAPSTSNRTLYGDSGANVLDGQGIATALVGAGGGDTFVYDQGYGALTIAEADAVTTPNNILQIGPGLSASSLTVTGSDSGDMILSFGGSDTITLAGALASGNGVTYGVQQVTFANGTTLSYADLLTLAETASASHTTLYGDSSANVLDGLGIAHTLIGGGGGDTFIFIEGYGQLTINEADTGFAPNNVLRLGSGLGAGNMSVTANASGDLILDFGSGDRITLANAFSSSSSTTYGVQEVKFQDGSSLTYAQLVALADTPSVSNTTLYGDTGANSLDGQGIAHTLVGNGGGDTFVFNQGYGALTIAENHPNAGDTNILQLGTGLAAANASVSADANGNLILDFSGGDVVTIQGALNAGTSASNGIQQVTFADGTTWTYAQILALADTGSATNTVLYSDGQGDTFDSKGLARTINSTGGGDTIIYNQGYGTLTINEADTSGYANNTLLFGAGLSASDVTVSADANDNIILSFGGGDVINLTGALQRSETTAYGVQNIQFADGTVWSIGDLRYQINPTTAGMAITNSNFAKTVNSDILDGGGWLSGNFGFTDSNTDDIHSVSVVGVSASGDVDPSLTNAQLLGFLKAAVGSDTSGSDAGLIHWSFIGAGVFDYLQPGQSATFDYTIAVSDGQGGELRQDVSVTVTDSPSGGGQLTLYGSDVTINYEPGRGDLYINDVAGITDPNNTLAFGAGIDPSMVTIKALSDPQATAASLLDSLQLVVAGSGTITLADALSDPTAGVQTVTFADGTVWTYAQIVAMLGLQHLQAYPYSGKVAAVGGIGADVLDSQGVAHIAEGNGGGDTFVYNRGYGALDIIENDRTTSTNTLAFGAGIAPDDVTITMAGIDQFKLSLGNGDVVTFAGSGGGLSNRSYWDANSSLSVPVTNAYTGIEAVTFADGTVWTVAQLVEHQVANSGILYGTEGSGIFDSKGTVRTINSAGANDKILYNLGYGSLTINENSIASNPSNALAFGPGITASMLSVSTDGYNLEISINGTDTITITGALGNTPDDEPVQGIQNFTFADGSSLSYADVLALADIPSASNTILYGDANAQTFDPQGIATEIDGGGGADTIVYKQGYGALAIYDSGQGATLKLGSGLTPANLALSHNGSDVVLSFGGADAITLSGEGDGNGVDTIVFGNGIVWNRSTLLAKVAAAGPFAYQPGDGAMTIDADAASSSPNVLQLNNLSISDYPGAVNYSIDSVGDLTLNFGGGDVLTILHQFNSDGSIAANGFQTISSASGNLESSDLSKLWFEARNFDAAPGQTNLDGDGRGGIFDPTGTATEISDTGGNVDTIRYDAGYGPLTINDLSTNYENSIVFGSGISLSSLTFSANANGDLIVSAGGNDQITIKNGLVMILPLDAGTIYNFVFSNGTSAYSWGSTIYGSDGSTANIDVSALANATLTGDAGAQILQGEGVVHNIVGGGGADQIYYDGGEGQLTINEADASGVSSSVLTIYDSNLHFAPGAGTGGTPPDLGAVVGVTENSAGDVTLHLGNGDDITLLGQLASPTGTAHGVSSITAVDSNYNRVTWTNTDILNALAYEASTGIIPNYVSASSVAIASGTASTGSVIEQANATGSASLDTASGAILFTDDSASPSDNASITGVSASGNTAGLSGNAALLAMLSLGPVSEPANGNSGSVSWSFSTADSAFDYLAVGETVTLTYAVKLANSSGSTDQDVTVTITGSNDAPTIVAGSSGTSSSLAITTGAASSDAGAGTIAFTDADLADTHSVSVNSVSASGAVDASGATVGLPSNDALLGLLTADVSGEAAGAVDWEFSASDATFAYLTPGQVLTLTYAVSVADNHGGVASQNVTVTITGGAGTSTNYNSAGTFAGVDYASYSNSFTASGWRYLLTFYDASGSEVASESFSPNGGYTITVGGALSQVQTVNADGSYDIQYYSAGSFAGVAYASYDNAYTAANFRNLLTFYDASGAEVASESFTPDGGYSITIGGVLSQVQTVNSDASFDIRYYSAGSFAGLAYASYDNAYTAANSRDLLTFYDASGAEVASESFTANGGYSITVGGVLSQVQTVNADGSFDIRYYGAGNFAGVTYASYDNAYTAANFRNQLTFYDASGAEVASESFTANGGYTITVGGGLSQAQTVNADGSYDIRYYSPGTFSGVAYDSYDNAYTSANFRNLLTFYDASGAEVASESFTPDGGYAITVGGALSQEQTVNADGSYDIRYYSAGNFAGLDYASYDNAYTAANFRNLLTFDDASGAEVASESFTVNGGYTITVDGAVSQVQTVNADGGLDIRYYSAGSFAGIGYASYDNAYTAAGFRNLLTFYDSAGAEVASESFTANGGYSITLGGVLSQVQTVKADGSYQLSYLNVAGQSYTQAQYAYGSDGTELALAETLADGSNATYLYSADLTLSDVSGNKSLSYGSDTFQFGADTNGMIDVSGADNAALAFGLGDGHQTINGFSTSGSGSDVLVFSKDIFADWAHLLGATTQQGSDLQITLDANDALLLKNVSLASFTSADARFL